MYGIVLDPSKDMATSRFFRTADFYMCITFEYDQHPIDQKSKVWLQPALFDYDWAT